ncbi:hypothetical protein L596_005729 [Steinernema carpocapsae]|uniref:Timeless N-terminal domain-containing protein n=1 Tax=Steinernema carpocapsae TaxID=34508 RepID=A0A4U8V1J3_STECR|nr:hypothetical protein L596_005729 [Steinernema carpocapsae]
MAAIVQSTIGALGYKDNRGVYHREPDCYESVRDLITFLRNDNQKTYRKICGTQNIVKTDLVPIMTDKSTPENLFDVALRLTINLCQPVVLVYRGEMPDSNEDWKMYMDLEANLRRSKAGFASVDFMKVLLKKIKKYFRMEWEIRSEAQKMIIERIMLLLKYALAIDSSENDKQRTSEDMNTHDRVVMAFLEAGLGPALIDIACNKYERDFHLHTLEIIALLLKEHKPVDIYRAGTEKQREADTAQLQKAVDQEKSKLLSKKRQVGSRHSGFAGAFTVKGLKAVNKENDMVVQRVVKDANSVNHLTERKNRLKASKKECTIDKAPTTHLSSEAVRVALKNFYEILMPSAFALLLKNAKEPAFGTQTLSNRNSDVHYFLAMRLGLEYAYLADLSFSFVEDVVTKNGFHHVQQTVFDFIDKMKVNKTEAKMIGAKSQYAVAALKELTICLNHYITKGTENIRELVKEIANDLLKLEEYRDTGFDMLKMFVPYAMPKQVLRDMVVFVHYYVRIMERSYKEGELRVVSKTAKVRSQRQNKKKAVEAEREQAETIDFLPADELVAIWDEQVAKSLTEVLNGEGTVDEDVVVIDALLKVSTKQEMSFAMLLIQRALREGDVSRAVGLHRGARELWPEGMFGKEGINPEEEFAELREVFNSDLSVIAGEYATERAKVYETSEFIEGGGELSEEDSEEQDQYLTKEINFDFKEYVIKFGRPEILRWYSLLFADYDKNPSEVNKCILKMMHRIAFDFSEPSRLYHVSVFSTLLNIRDELKNLPNTAIKNHKHCELYRFGIHLLRKFMSTWKERGGKLIPELLFWKTSSEVFDIENGYGAFDKDRSRKGILWPEELEDEVEKLHEEFMGFEDKPQGMDVADFIEHNLSETRNRKQILKLLKKLSMDMGDLRITKKFTSGKPDIFTAEVTENMKVWVEQFKEIKEKDEEMEEVKDVVEYIQMRLPEIASRSKIMKQLKYCGIEIGSKRGWSSDMDNELRSLKEEYDAGVEAFSGDLLDYIVLKINGTKSRGQVKSRLQKLNIEFQTVRKTAKMRRAIEAGYDDDFRKELDAILELPDYEERETRPRSRSPELELDFSDLSDAESTSGDSGPAKEDLKSPHPDDEGMCKSEQSDEPKEDRVDDDDDVSFSPNARKRVRVMLSDDENDIEEPVAISRKRSLSEVLTTMSGDEDAGGMAAPTSPKRKRVVISDDEDSD